MPASEGVPGITGGMWLESKSLAGSAVYPDSYKKVAISRSLAGNLYSSLYRKEGRPGIFPVVRRRELGS